MHTIEAVRRQAVTVESNRTIREAAVLMESEATGSLVVVDGGSLVGIVTDRDLVRRGIAAGVDADARIDSVMTTPVVTIDADADLHLAYGVFGTHGIRRLVVLSKSTVVGVVTIDDLLIDLVGDLSNLARPVTGESIFGQHDSPVPTRR